ncbi:MAG TPA: YcnI family protein [Roseomonas sp.]|jgi:uncharacterized protein YcnI
MTTTERGRIMGSHSRAIAAALLVLTAASPASAHITLDRAEIPADSTVRLALRVGHGCQGAATTGIRVTVPPELRGARPMPHPGWTLSIGGKAPAEHGAHAGHGAHMAAAHGSGHQSAPAAGEIAWTDGRLDDVFFDEFVLLIRTPAEPGTVIALPILQECEGGVVMRWTERASAQGERVANPAPLLRVVPGR